MLAFLGSYLKSDNKETPVLVANSQSESGPAVNKFVTPQNPTGIKPCCACPNTKQPRDDCFLKYGPEAIECADLVAAHRQCMESLGFKI